MSYNIDDVLTIDNFLKFLSLETETGLLFLQDEAR